MRTLTRAHAASAARGQGRRRRVHLVPQSEHYEGMLGRTALCGASPKGGFARQYRDDPSADCERCDAKVRDDDEIEQ